jgi:hypothetical protein
MYNEERPVVTNERQNPLKPLAELLSVEIKEYRSGYYLVLPKNWEKLLPDTTKDRDYAKGWFDARGKKQKEPLKLTISGQPDKFIKVVESQLNIELPKPQRPSPNSEMRRLTVTGDKAQAISNWLK